MECGAGLSHKNDLNYSCSQKWLNVLQIFIRFHFYKDLVPHLNKYSYSQKWPHVLHFCIQFHLYKDLVTEVTSKFTCLFSSTSAMSMQSLVVVAHVLRELYGVHCKQIMWPFLCVPINFNPYYICSLLVLSANHILLNILSIRPQQSYSVNFFPFHLEPCP